MREDSPVKPETREQILSVAEEMGYHGRPRVGRPRQPSLRSRQIVEVIIGLVDQEEHPFYAGLLAALERELKSASYDCLIRTCDGSYASFLSLSEAVETGDARGTIVTGHFTAPQLQTLLELQPKALLVDNPGHPAIEAPYGYVAFDNREAGRLATRHLLDNGRRRILLLKGREDHFFSDEIEEGWRDAHTRADQPVDETLIRLGHYDADEARDTIFAALDEGLQFDAVFTNDEMACGVLQALHMRRLAVPDQIAVIGCDGLPIGTRVYPRLSTIVLDYDELARQAVEMLSNSICDHREPWRCRLVPSLLVRESSPSPS